MSPTCCDASKGNQAVRLFLSGIVGACWVVAGRDDVGSCDATALFCPFCGTKLKLEHVPFAETEPRQRPDQ